MERLHLSKILLLDVKIRKRAAVQPCWDASHIRIFAGNLSIIVMQDEGHVRISQLFFRSGKKMEKDGGAMMP